MKRIRILFLPPVDSDNNNAQSLNAREIALRLDPRRFEVTFWYERESDPRLRNVENIGLLRLPRKGKTLRILREMLSSYDILAYVDYSPAAYLYLHLPRVMRRAKAVFHAEAPLVHVSKPPRLLSFLQKGVFPNCDSYSAITEFVAEDVRRQTRRPVDYILPVGVNTSLFNPPRERTTGPPIVLFAGTLVDRKRPQSVLEAALQFPETKFQLVGDGRGGFERVLRQKIVDMNLKNVTLLGPKTQLELVEIMRASDIFLLPSRIEGIPKVTLEAAACGLPCVVFRDYQTPSVVDGVTGFQVRSDEEMLRALGRLIASRELRQKMGAAAREHSLGFDWGGISRQWENAYLEIAEKS
ncbi:MAG: glycosyltransferase family 4 protein [Acidobacteriales bacterium]|nr:glycosyltransferase family 4 protein [Terriglobales bacterium]